MLPASDVKLPMMPPSLEADEGGGVTVADEASPEVGVEVIVSEVGLETPESVVTVPLLSEVGVELSVVLTTDVSEVMLPLDESVVCALEESVVEAESDDESVVETDAEDESVADAPPGSVELAGTMAAVGVSSPKMSPTTSFPRSERVEH